MTSRAMKAIAPTIAPTTTPMGIVVEDEDDEELVEEAAGRGVVRLIPISFTQKRSSVRLVVVGFGIAVLNIVRFIWSGIYPIVRSEPRTTGIEPP